MTSALNHSESAADARPAGGAAAGHGGLLRTGGPAATGVGHPGGSWLAAIGSLWVAVLLLVLLAFAMASATVYEASRGTEQALAVYYKSWWFMGLQALLAVNCLAAIVARLPVTRRQFGFLLTHLSILVVLIGAVVTWLWGIEGQVALQNGESTEVMRMSRDALVLEDTAGGDVRNADLGGAGLGGLRAVESPRVGLLALDHVSVEIRRYVADSEEREQVVEDAHGGRPAIEASVTLAGSSARGWVFADQPAAVGSVSVGFRRIDDGDELQRLLATAPQTQPASPGTLRVELPTGPLEIAVDEAMQAAVPLGETGRSVRVLRYLPHAMVGAGRQIENASDRPINPAVELEITGGQEPERRVLFARFPDFGSLHGQPGNEQLKMTFVATASSPPSAPIEVLAGPRGDLHARFSAGEGLLQVAPVAIGAPADTPWPGVTLTVHRFAPRVLVRDEVVAVDPPRQERNPAILVAIRSPERSEPEQVWLQKHTSRRFSAGTAAYRLSYTDQTFPLGFRVSLEDFTIGRYPGTGRPRSFESRVIFGDPATSQDRPTISMNHPAKYGGYTFYQSSYREDPRGGMITFLSVSWDPGQPVVFAGYIGMMAGMVWVLVLRVSDRRRIARAQAKEAGAGADAVMPRQAADRGAQA